MVEAGIMRAPTEQERSDYRQVGVDTPKDVFLRKLSFVEAKYTKEHKPFDGQCAKLDFVDKLDMIERESERIYGYVRVEDINKIDIGDFEEYGDKDRFELIGDDEEIEMQNVNNTKTAIVTGHTLKYKCKQRGHGISVFVPIDVYGERKSKLGKVKEE